MRCEGGSFRSPPPESRELPEYRPQHRHTCAPSRHICQSTRPQIEAQQWNLLPQDGSGRALLVGVEQTLFNQLHTGREEGIERNHNSGTPRNVVDACHAQSMGVELPQ